MRTCEDCGGKGMIPDKEYPLASRVCPYCGGSGEINDDPISIRGVPHRSFDLQAWRNSAGPIFLVFALIMAALFLWYATR